MKVLMKTGHKEQKHERKKYLGRKKRHIFYRRYLKRLLDIMFSILVFPFVFLVIVFFSPLIWLEDRGPVFFNAMRVGQHGRLFIMYKLRTMKVNSPDIRYIDGSTYNSSDDPRVTKIGSFLRRTSIDELPQIYNIIRGEMSFIGPRPDPPDWITKYSDDVKRFLNVKPGITGYNQAYFRNLADGELKMKNDVYYAQNHSIILDIKIFFRTIKMVIRRENIYKDENTKVT